MATPNETAEQKAYRARDALATIHRAAEHQKDAGLMREVRKIATEQMKATAGVEKRDSGGAGSERKRVAEKPEAPKVKAAPVKMAKDKDKSKRGGEKGGYFGIKGMKG